MIFIKDKSRFDNRHVYCKQCKSGYSKRFSEKYPWLSILHNINNRCHDIKNNRYHRYGGRGIKCLITAEELKELWFRDKAYLMKKPSIDRENNDGHYVFDNCRFIEFGENSAKDKRKAILQFDLKGIFIKEWDSQARASRELKISQGNITGCCAGNRKHASGFIWRFK